MLGDTQYTKCFCSFLVQFSSSVSSRHPLHRSRRGPRAARPRAAAALGCRRATADRGQKQTRHPGVPTRQPNSARHGGRCARAAMLVCAVVLRPAVPVPPLDLELVWGRELRTPTRAGRGTGHLQSCSACTIASPTSGCTSRPSPDPALPPDATQGTCATCNPHPEQKSTWAEGQEGQAQLFGHTNE